MARLLREGSDDLVVLLLSFLDTKDLDQCRATSQRLCSVGGGSAWLWRLQLSRCFLFSLAPSARRARAAGSGAAWRSLYRKAMGSLMRQEKRWRERETRAWASYERARQPAAPHLGAVEELLEAEKEVFRERQLMDVFCAMGPFEGGRAATALDVGGGPHNGCWYVTDDFLNEGTPLVSPDVDDPSAALIQLVLDVVVATSRLGGEWMGAGNIETNLGDAFAELPYHDFFARDPPLFGHCFDLDILAEYLLIGGASATQGQNTQDQCKRNILGADLPGIAADFFTGSDALSPQEMEVLQSAEPRLYYLQPKRDDEKDFVCFWHPLDDLPHESWMRDSLARPPQTLRRWVETRGDRTRPARIVVDVADVSFSAPSFFGAEPLCVDREAAALVADALRAFFSVEVVLRDSSLEARCPPRKQRKMRGDLAGYTEHVNGYTGPQVDADALIQWAAKQRDAIEAPAPGDVSVCLCACDLYSTKAPWNFLWGWSKTFLPGGRDAPHDGAAPILLSLARGGTADRPPDPPEIIPGSVRAPPRPPRAGVWAGTPGLAHLLTHHVRTVAVAAFGLGQCRPPASLFRGNAFHIWVRRRAGPLRLQRRRLRRGARRVPLGALPLLPPKAPARGRRQGRQTPLRAPRRVPRAARGDGARGRVPPVPAK